VSNTKFIVKQAKIFWSKFHAVTTIEWRENKVKLIDQTKLPSELVYLNIDQVEASARQSRSCAGAARRRSASRARLEVVRDTAFSG
jgi:hypothetical protein